MAFKSRLAKSLLISISVNTAVVSAIGSSGLLRGHGDGKNVVETLGARPISSYKPRRLLPLIVPTPTPPPPRPGTAANPNGANSQSKNSVIAGVVAMSPLTAPAATAGEGAGDPAKGNSAPESAGGAASGGSAARPTSAVGDSQRLARAGGAGYSRTTPNAQDEAGAQRQGTGEAGDAANEAGQSGGGSEKAGDGLSQAGAGGRAGANQGSELSGQTKHARQNGRARSGAAPSQQSAAPGAKSGVARTKTGAAAHGTRKAEGGNRKRMLPLFRVPVSPFRVQRTAADKNGAEAKTSLAGTSAAPAGAADEAAKNGARDKAATPDAKTIAQTGLSKVATPGQTMGEKTKGGAKTGRGAAKPTKTLLALVGTAGAQKSNGTDEDNNAAAVARIQDTTDDDALTLGDEKETVTPEDKATAPPKMRPSALAKVVLKNWNAAPGQKIVLPDKLDLSLLKDLKALPVSNVTLTTEQREQIRKLLEGQNLKQIAGLDKTLLKKLIDASKKADRAPEDDKAEDFDLEKQKAKKKAGTPRTQGKRDLRPPRDVFATMPSDLVSPFKYRPWSPAYRTRYEKIVRAQAETPARIASIKGLDAEVRKVREGIAPAPTQNTTQNQGGTLAPSANGTSPAPATNTVPAANGADGTAPAQNGTNTANGTAPKDNSAGNVQTNANGNATQAGKNPTGNAVLGANTGANQPAGSTQPNAANTQPNGVGAQPTGGSGQANGANSQPNATGGQPAGGGGQPGGGAG